MYKIGIFITLISYCLIAKAQTNKADSLQNLFNKAVDDSTKAALLFGIGDFYISHIPDSALFYYDKALAVSEKHCGSALTATGDLQSDLTIEQAMFLCMYAEILRSIGQVYRNTGDYTKAKEYIQKSLKYFEGLANSPYKNLEVAAQKEISNCYSEMGIVNRYEADYEQAIENYEKAIKNNERLQKQCKGIKDITDLKNSIAACYNNLGNTYNDQGCYDKALVSFQKAMKLFEELMTSPENATAKKAKKGISQCYTNIGNAYRIMNLNNKNQGDAAIAISYYIKSSKIKEELKDKKGMAFCFNNIGNVYNDMARYAMAMGFYQKALSIFEEISDKKSQSTCLLNLGGVHHHLQNFDKAYEYYFKSMKLKEELGDRNGLSGVYNNLSMMNNVIADSVVHTKAESKYYHQEAVKYGLQAMKIAEEIESTPRMRDVSAQLLIAYKWLGNTKEALKYAEVLISASDSLFQEEKAKAIADMEARYQTEKKQMEIEGLKNEKSLQSERILRQQKENQIQRLVIYGFMVVVVIILVFSLLLYRLFRQKKAANKLLGLRNAEITQQKEEIASQRDLVTQQKNHIEEIHREVTDSIIYAKRIQHAVMPKRQYIDGIMGDYFILFKPKDIVSGDFYWATHVETRHASSLHVAHPGLLIVAVADCTGHGVPGAFMSMMGIAFLNEIVRHKQVTQAGSVLNEMRNHIVESLQQQGLSNEQDDGMDMTLCVINNCTDVRQPADVSTYNLQFAGANIPLYVIARRCPEFVEGTKDEAISSEGEIASLPLAMTQPDATLPNEMANALSSDGRIRNDENRLIEIKADMSAETNAPIQKPTLIEVKADKMPIAIYENMLPFTQHELQVAKGDIIYLTSDGYPDQFGGPNGKKFSTKRFKELLIQTCPGMSQQITTMEEQKDILDKTIDEWKNSHQAQFEQTDDITVLGIRI